MENKDYKEVKTFANRMIVILAISVFLFFLYRFVSDKPNTKNEIEKAENRAKVSVYKTQEVEALKNFYTLQTMIDRLEEIQDSVLIEKVEKIHPGDIQKELNDIFNQSFQ